MRISAWMKHPVITVKPHDSAQDARMVMEKHRINQLPVVVNDRLVGIVTDRDLRDVFPSVLESGPGFRRQRTIQGTAPSAVPVEDVMTRDVHALAPTAFVADAARLMRRERIGAVPIVEGHRLVGILARSDVLDAFDELARRALPAG